MKKETPATSIKQYAWDILPKLSFAIENGLSEEATTLLNKILDVLCQHHAEIYIRKYRCAMIMSHCIRGAYSGGVETEKLLSLQVDEIENLMRLKSWSKICDFMRKYTITLIELLPKATSLQLENYIQDICKNMGLHLPDPVPLSKYAKKLNVSTAHLSRVFKQKTGLSFSTFYKELKIKNAIHLLATKGWKIESIARECGFKSTPHFIETFKKTTGVTPGDYKNKKLKKISII